MYVCMYVCVGVYVRTQTDLKAKDCKLFQDVMQKVSMHMPVCMYVYMCMYMYMYMQKVSMHMYMHMYMYMQKVGMHVHACTAFTCPN
jgi:hypothetical protein